jgi:chromosome segregation ATPase
LTQERTQAGVHDGTRSHHDDGDSAGGKSAETSDRFDFERLERSVEFLIEEHQRLSAERAELLEELVDREQRLASLESELESERQRRLTAVEGVDKILGRLAQLQTSVSAAVESA